MAAVPTQYMFTYISDINPSIYYSKYCVPEGLERMEFKTQVKLSHLMRVILTTE